MFLCLPNNREINVKPLDSNSRYPSPEGSFATACTCNGISYNLMVSKVVEEKIDSVLNITNAIIRPHAACEDGLRG
jgi:hypothetical protein